MERPIPTDIYPCQIAGWPLAKPLYIGEFLWIPSAMFFEASSVFYGDNAYRDLPGYYRQTEATTWDYQIEAYRALGVQGISPFTIWSDWVERLNPVYYAMARQKFAPNGLYLREKNTRFFTGDTVRRTAYLFNNRLEASHLTVTWRLEKDGQAEQIGSQLFYLQPAEISTFTLAFSAPSDEGEAILKYEVERAGETVFSDQQPIHVYAWLAIESSDTLYLYDPAGATAAELSSQNIAHTLLSDLAQLPSEAEVLLVGGGALTNTLDWQRIESFARGGGRVLLLDQNNFPRGVPVRTNDHAATIAFARRPSHPVLADVTEDELRFWASHDLQTANRVITKSLGQPDCGQMVNGDVTTLLGQVENGDVLWLHKPTSATLSQLALAGITVPAAPALPGLVTVADSSLSAGTSNYSLNWQAPRLGPHFDEAIYGETDFSGATEVPFSDFTVRARPQSARSFNREPEQTADQWGRLFTAEKLTRAEKARSTGKAAVCVGERGPRSAPMQCPPREIPSRCAQGGG